MEFGADCCCWNYAVTEYSSTIMSEDVSRTGELSDVIIYVHIKKLDPKSI